MNKTLALIALAAGTMLCAGARADESKLHLKDAPETRTVVAGCSICHSVDYIQMNSRFMNRAAWEAEVKKMVSVMGAPISDADQSKIIDYLAREYGVPN